MLSKVPHSLKTSLFTTIANCLFLKTSGDFRKNRRVAQAKTRNAYTPSRLSV